MSRSEHSANESLSSSEVHRHAYKPTPKKGANIWLVVATLITFITIGAMFAVGISH